MTGERERERERERDTFSLRNVIFTANHKKDFAKVFRYQACVLVVSYISPACFAVGVE